MCCPSIFQQSENESNADDISMPDMMGESPPKRPRAGQNIATHSLAAALDRTQVSDRKAAIILTETARSLGYDPLTLAINRNSISHSRKTARAKFVENIQNEFHTKEALTDLQFIGIRELKAVEYFLLPLPAPYKVSRFQVCFRFQPLSSKCFRFHKNLIGSTSSFRFHIPAACFMKNASASGSSKSQMLPSSFSASFFKVLPQNLTTSASIPDWDGKFLEGLATIKYVDRLPVIVSGLSVNRLLGILKLASVTGEAQAQAVIDA